MPGEAESVLIALKDLPSTLSGLRQVLQTLSASRGVSIGAGVLQVFEVSFNKHLFKQTDQPLQALPQKEVLPHPVEAIIVKGSYDYQVEYDRNVQDTTPVTNALEYQNFSLSVAEYFTFKISPDAMSGLPAGTQGTMNYWAFWRE